ncbi:nose resistant to fluoxetine protein 6-like isoform X1 [Dermacentor variabilis]|uniref:nose resistant to fluoxetine protein 6-like isoform X1 n=2 Tax=Dermacentor variabilis TaxID=34621 RepID=UPI003F5B46CC
MHASGRRVTLTALVFSVLVLGVWSQESATRSYEEDLRDIGQVVIRKFFPIVSELVTSPELSVDCSSSLLKTFSGLRQHKAWAYRMILSNAMLSSNALEGTYVAMGGYDQCLRTRVYLSDGELDFKGQYCSLFYMLPPAYFETFIKRFHEIGELTGRKNPLTATSADEFQSVDTRGALCTPSTCTEEDMTFIIRSILTLYGGNATVMHCRTDDPKSLNTVHIICLSILGFLLLLVFVGTGTELIIMKRCPKKKHSAGGPLRLILSFSAITNTWYLLRMDVKPERKPLKFMAGLKVIMAFWVVLGHTYILVPTGFFHSVYTMEYMTWNVTFEFIINALLSVTTFFFISGFLLSYLVTQSRSTVLKNNLLMVYISRGVRRYIRLTIPTLVVLVVGLLLPLMGSGPADEDAYNQHIRSCYHNWWRLIVQAQNFVEEGQLCFQHLWYVSTDLQIFMFIAFPLTLLLLKYPKTSYVIGGTVAVAFCILTCFQTHSWNLFYSLTGGSNDMRKMQRTLLYVYIRPFTHVATYIVGILCGYAASQHKNKHIHLLLQALLWCVSLLLACLVMFVTLPWNQGTLPGDVSNYIYAGFHRIAWALAFCWPTYACATGRGGWLNKIFSWKFFIPLSRLTFSIYLVHVLIFIVRMIRLRTYINTDEFYQLNTALGVFALSTVFAYVLHILIEAPIFQLEKIIFERKREEHVPQTSVKHVNGVDHANGFEQATSKDELKSSIL